MTDVQGDNMRSADRCGVGQLTILFIAVAFTGFAAGYITADLRNRQMVYEEGRRQFVEFLSIARDLEIVTIDQQKLDEVIQAGAEGDYPDEASTNEAVSSTDETAGVEHDEGKQ